MAITNIEDAKWLKKIGQPLNTPVENRQFSPVYEKHWLALNKAHYEFMIALAAFFKDQSGPKRKQAKKQLKALSKTMQQCDAAIAGFEEEGEQAAMGWFLVERAVPLCNFWLEAFATIEAGEEFAFKYPDDMPPWLDKDEP